MRVLTYNIHSGRGVDGRYSVRRISEVIASARADVVALQEVLRFPLVYDQPWFLGRALRMKRVFQRNRGEWWIGGFGNLVLVRGEVRDVTRLPLPSRGEQRGCIVARVESGGIPFTFACTHLGLDHAERADQLAALAEALPQGEPVLLAGDFNARPGEVASKLSGLVLPPHSPLTYDSPDPDAAIDHVAFSPHWRAVDVRTVPSQASDHLPLLVDLDLVTQRSASSDGQHGDPLGEDLVEAL